jgi:opacity protein-like surface antigen
MRFFTRPVVTALLLTAFAAPAAAQADEQRLTLTFAPAFATVDGNAELALSGSVAYRFTDHLSFEGDFTWIDAAAGGGFGRVFPLGVDPTTSVGTNAFWRASGPFNGNIGRLLPAGNVNSVTSTLIWPPIDIPGITSDEGQTMIGTLGVRLEPLVQTARFRPYVSAGLGVNHTDQTINIELLRVTSFFDDTPSHSGLAFSAGGGANIRLAGSFWANADAKYFRLSRDRNIMRLGGGVGFRF